MIKKNHRGESTSDTNVLDKENTHLNIFAVLKSRFLGQHHLFSVECKKKRFQCVTKELTGLFRLFYDRATPVLQNQTDLHLLSLLFLTFQCLF